jgi:hypothetical protein
VNERIDQLWGRALDQAVPETWTTLNPAQLSKLKEKFAKLIVRECADIAKHNVMNISTYADADFVDAQIKKHFGVEE